jgi:hypothetical protein
VHNYTQKPDSGRNKFRARRREKDGVWLGGMNQSGAIGVIILAALLLIRIPNYCFVTLSTENIYLNLVSTRRNYYLNW